MLIKDHVEEHSKGAVEMEVVDYESDAEQLRKHLFQQFGSGTSGDIHTRGTEYDAGLPEKGQKAFPVGVDMKEKLRQLHAKKMVFWSMCDPDKRADYAYCQYTKLIRIVLEHVNHEYKECVSRLLDKGNKRKREANQDDSEDDNLATILATCIAMVGTARTYPRHPIGLDMPHSSADYAPSMLSSLHDTSANIGWDTDAALTVTCLRDDMLWIDDSEEAIRSIPSLQGINGGSSIVGGVGPCLVRSKCGCTF